MTALIIEATREAIGLVEDIVVAGKNPVKVIRRIRQSGEFLEEVEDAWEDAIDAKYPDDD